VDPGLEQAVERARKGDASAFDAIVLEYGTPLVRFLCGVLAGDVHAAHDVAQDAFLAAWRALPRLEEPRLLRAWIYRVAYHRAITWLRRRGPRGNPFRFLDSEGMPASASIPSGDERESPPRAGEPSPVTPRLRAALSALPPTYAAAVSLYYFQGLGTDETAQALGVTRSTVKMRLHRARTVLRRTLLAPEGAKEAGEPARPAKRRASTRRRSARSAVRADPTRLPSRDPDLDPDRSAS
jgi:RNA polymerase sigma-70 factor (ECF subfamily)